MFNPDKFPYRVSIPFIRKDIPGRLDREYYLNNPNTIATININYSLQVTIYGFKTEADAIVFKIICL